MIKCDHWAWVEVGFVMKILQSILDLDVYGLHWAHKT